MRDLLARIRAFLPHAAWAVVLVVVIGGLGVAGVRVTMKRWRISREISSLRAEISSLEQKRIELSKILLRGNDPASIEREARRNFGFSREGEKVVILVPGDVEQAKDAPGEPEQDNEEQPAEEKDEANLMKWWHRFFGP